MRLKREYCEYVAAHLLICYEKMSKHAQSKPAWIKASDRLPTKEDGDCFGNVWYLHPDPERGVEMTSWMAEANIRQIQGLCFVGNGPTSGI